MRGIRWLAYFRLPESVTLPFITTARIPEPPPPERCTRRSTNFCRALSELPFPQNMVRSLRERNEELAAVQRRRRPEGEPTIKAAVGQ
jgi:hypothetical protein